MAQRIWRKPPGSYQQNHSLDLCAGYFFSIIGLVYSIKLPVVLAGIQLNVAIIVLVLVTVYYISLSKTRWPG